jgi:hypothetical protein
MKKPDPSICPLLWSRSLACEKSKPRTDVEQADFASPFEGSGRPARKKNGRLNAAGAAGYHNNK